METVLFALKYAKHLVKEHLLKPFESLHGLMVQYAKPDCEFDKYVPRHRRHEKVVPTTIDGKELQATLNSLVISAMSTLSL